jgi:hypothetical protein
MKGVPMHQEMSLLAEILSSAKVNHTALLTKLRALVAGDDLLAQRQLLDLLNSHQSEIGLESFEIEQMRIIYLTNCIRDNAVDERIPSGFAAANDLRSRFLALWKEGQGQKHPERTMLLLESMRTSLAMLCQSDRSVQDRVLTGILEHLFQFADIQRFFSGWEKDRSLSSCYKEALFLSRQSS